MTRRGPHRLVVVALVLSAALAAAAPAAAKTVWLCKPGLKDNPCTPSLRTTVLSPDEKKLATLNVKRPTRPKYDCFYVYPTVSNQPGVQATKSIDPELRSIALYQAARYSRDCRVYAPVYRQITLDGLSNPAVTRGGPEARLRGRARGLAHLPAQAQQGRGVVLLGHSQGTFVLRDLVKREIDRAPKVRRRLISAVLLGGKVTVRKGRDSGGDFRKIRACRSPKQFRLRDRASPPSTDPCPPTPAFGRTSRRPSRGAVHQSRRPGRRLGNGRARVPHHAVRSRARSARSSRWWREGRCRAASTPWISVPGRAAARCSSAGGADVLQVTS